MNDPFRRFKQQPWLPLFRVAGLTAAMILLIEFMSVLGMRNSAGFAEAVEFVLSGLLGMIVLFLAAVGTGAASVYFCEKYAPDVYLNNESLWALILCLAVAMGVKSLVPILQILVPFSSTALMGIAVGVFWKGRPYWRRF